MLDLRILNGLVVSDGTAGPADVGIEGGRVAEAGPPGTVGRARDEVDASGLYVLPGVVDPHFHCRAPSHPERGDFASETRAAASGGVTTVLEMPISDPACSTPAVLRARRELGERQCYVDFGLYAGGAVKTESEAMAMAEGGAIAFKLFTHSPVPQRAHEFEGIWATTEDAIYDALEAISATGLVCTVHAENEALLRSFARRADGGADAHAHDHAHGAAGGPDDEVPARPPVIEATAVAMVGALASATGTRVHIAHVTSGAALRALRAARVMGADMSGETCPQYLVFDHGAVARLGAFAKVAPPLRSPADAEALWQGLLDGTLALVASDHAPFLAEEKRRVGYASAPQGLPTVETMLPILLDAALAGRLPLELAVDLVTRRPAERFGLYPRKGTLAVGADADVALFSPEASTRLSVRSLVSRAASCGLIYEGMELRGRVVRTIVGGRTVYLAGKILQPPSGRFVQPHHLSAWRSA